MSCVVARRDWWENMPDDELQNVLNDLDDILGDDTPIPPLQAQNCITLRRIIIEEQERRRDAR